MAYPEVHTGGPSSLGITMSSSGEILPEYFRTSKISSFYSQLNVYGFEWITIGCNIGAYYNEYFLRGVGAVSHKEYC